VKTQPGGGIVKLSAFGNKTAGNVAYRRGVSSASIAAGVMRNVMTAVSNNAARS